jgi:hypothetical protein
MSKKRKFKSYRKVRTNREEYAFLIEVRNRLQFRLSHQEECYICSVRVEEMELEDVIRQIQVMDEIGFGMLGGCPDPNSNVFGLRSPWRDSGPSKTQLTDTPELNPVVSDAKK